MRTLRAARLGGVERAACTRMKSFASSFGLATLLAGGFFGTALVVACSSTTDSAFPVDPPKPDAEPDAPGPLVGEGGLGPPDAAEAGPTSCPPSIPPGFTPTWTPPTVTASACSATDLTDYFHACLENPGVTEKDGTCTTFKTAHKACTDCAEPADGTGPIQWQSNRKFYTSNIAGCIAVEQMMPEADKCGAAYNAAVQCSRASCTYCFDQGGTFEQFSTCQKDASKIGQCMSLGMDETAKCAGFNAGPAAKCLKTTSNEANDSYYPRLVGIICGPP
ncbi:MAG: hypothetical protein JWO86_2732 [Myxococcaceae bacterium]|nr:hypothetical protein [Myxococcaceae bacterium]MEA2749601.1 hypothetical protein [Myxococcales bacterium]